MVQISAKSANLQQNLCNKPRGSGEGEICGFPRFEGHWLRVQRKASICSKNCVINRVVPEREKFRISRVRRLLVQISTKKTLPFSQFADNQNGMQVRYLVGARAAVGRWVSMRHYVMAFGTVFHSVHPACGMKNAKISRRQSQRDAGALLGGSKGCGWEMGVDAPLRDGFWDGGRGGGWGPLAVSITERAK